MDSMLYHPPSPPHEPCQHHTSSNHWPIITKNLIINLLHWTHKLLFCCCCCCFFSSSIWRNEHKVRSNLIGMSQTYTWKILYSINNDKYDKYIVVIITPDNISWSMTVFFFLLFSVFALNVLASIIVSCAVHVYFMVVRLVWEFTLYLIINYIICSNDHVNSHKNVEWPNNEKENKSETRVREIQFSSVAFNFFFFFFFYRYSMMEVPSHRGEKKSTQWATKAYHGIYVCLNAAILSMKRDTIELISVFA